MPRLALCSENEKKVTSLPLVPWYHVQNSSGFPVFAAERDNHTLWPGKKANDGVVHLMSKEEDCPQEQK